MEKVPDVHNISNVIATVPFTLLNQIIQHVDTGIFICDLDGALSHYNRTFVSLTGYASGELTHVKMFLGEEGLADLSIALKKVQTADHTSTPLLIRRKDGAEVCVNVDLFMQHGGGKRDFVYAVLHVVPHSPLTGHPFRDAFYLLAENTSDIVTRHNRDLRYAYVNSVIEKHTGIPASEWIGKSYRDVGMPEEVCKFWDENLLHVFEHQNVHSVEFEVPGRTVYLHSRLIPEFDESGQVVSVLVVSRELSEKRRIEENLIRLAAHLQLATESANVGTWLYDVDTQKIEWSALQNKLWGYPENKNDLSFADWHRGIHPDDRDRVVGAFQDFLANRHSYDVEYRVIRQDDESVTWVRSVGKFHSSGPDMKDVISGITMDISTHKLSEERLRHGEEQFRATFENAAVGMAHVSTDGRWVRVNSRLCEIVGYPQSELLGLTFQEITYPPDLEADLGFVRQLLNKSIPNYSIEKRYIQKAGQLIWVNLTVSLVRSRLDEPLYFIAVIQDITERKRIEEAVRESNERYRLINKATQDAIWDWNLKTNEIIWNEAVYSMFGHDPAHVDPNIDWWYSSIHPEDSQRVVGGIHHAIDSGAASWSDQYRFLSGDGTYKIVFDRGFVQHDDKGTAVRMLGSMQDITERTESVARLEQNEARFRTLANSISHLAWIANSEGWIFWYNERWFDYTGTTLEEMQGWGWEKVHHPHHRDRILKFVREAWKKDEPFELTFPLRAKDGAYRWFLTRAFPVKDNTGKIVQWVGTNTDIHDQKTLAEKLEAMVSERTRELQRSNEDLQQFAHIVSHDLKEPVRKITTFGNRLEMELSGVSSDKAQTYLKKIMHASDRLTQMIEGTLAYSTVDARANEFEQVDLNKVISDIETDLEVVIQMKNARIIKETLPVIEGAPLLLYQLFYNLINNSLKFVRPGVPTVVSIRSLPQTEKYATLIVSDNGIGFDSIYAEKIFNAYIRLNSKDQFEGTGLGLALCKKIVQRHNGTISATSAVNEGATFTIRLPVVHPRLNS